VAVFQPHRYSRTEQLWSTFRDSFTDADVLVVTGIYSSGEAPRPGITGQLVAGAVSEAHPGADVRYRETLDEVVDELAAELREGDLCITLGAGDLTTVPDRVLSRLQTERP
jgi:UDP-N-acetylmuramate--alanine ligase